MNKLHLATLALFVCACLGGPPAQRPDAGGSEDLGANADEDAATQTADTLSDDDEHDDASTTPVPELPRDYARSTPFPKLELVVDHVAGLEPRRAAVEHVEVELAEVVDKPDGVEFVLRDVIETPGPGHVWTFEELNTLARERFGAGYEGEAVQIGVLYVDGSYEGDSDGARVLGVAWANRYLVMFSDSIEAACSAPVVTDAVCSAAESSVLLHEVGHVVGLVDNGAPMVTDHRDPDHGKHDVNDECVMYWSYTSSDIISALLARVGEEELALTFDAACVADLEAMQ